MPFEAQLTDQSWAIFIGTVEACSDSGKADENPQNVVLAVILGMVGRLGSGGRRSVYGRRSLRPSAVGGKSLKTLTQGIIDSFSDGLL